MMKKQTVHLVAGIVVVVSFYLYIHDWNIKRGEIPEHVE